MDGREALSAPLAGGRFERGRCIDGNFDTLARTEPSTSRCPGGNQHRFVLDDLRYRHGQGRSRRSAGSAPNNRIASSDVNPASTVT